MSDRLYAKVNEERVGNTVWIAPSLSGFHSSPSRNGTVDVRSIACDQTKTGRAKVAVRASVSRAPATILQRIDEKLET